MPIKPSKNESKEDFMKRCVPKEISAGHSQDQAIAICMSKWENKKMLPDSWGNTKDGREILK